MKKLYTTLVMLVGLFTMPASAQFWSNNLINYPQLFGYPYDIDVVDANVAWTSTSYLADGSGATVQMYSVTTDAGANWTGGYFTADTNYQVSNMSAVDANTCYILTFNQTAGVGGYLFKTSDGGANWDTIATGQIFTDPNSFPNVVHFFDANNGMVMGDPTGGYYEIYTTSDAGATWTRVPQANIPAPSAGEYGIINVYGALGDFIWFGSNNGKVYRSYNRGLNWVASTAGAVNANNSVTNVSFADSLTGFCVRATTAGAYTYFSTTNAGATWTPVIPNGTYFTFDMMYVPGSSAIISVGASNVTGGGSSISYDNGANWVTLDTVGAGSVYGYTALDFIDPVTGYAGSLYDASQDGGINKWIGGTVGVNSLVSANNNMNAYPNPSAGTLYLETSSSFKHDVTISIVDMMGKVVSERNYGAWANPVMLNVNSLQNGVYLVRVTSGNDVMVKRFVKQ